MHVRPGIRIKFFNANEIELYYLIMGAAMTYLVYYDNVLLPKV